MSLFTRSGRSIARTLLRLWIPLALLTGGIAFAQPALNKTIRVVGDDNYPPFLFRDEAGRTVGYVADWWKLWEQKTGVKVALNATEWAKAQRIITRGDADVIDNIFRTPERETLYDFTAPYATVPVGVFVHTSIAGINDVKGMRGFQVGVMDGDACVEMLRHEGIETLRLYKSYLELIRGAVAGDVRMFCLDDYPASYYLYHEKVQTTFRKAFQLYEGKFHRAVRKGHPETLALIERGAAAISPAEDKTLRDKWMPPNPVDRERIVQVGAAVLGGIALLATVLLVWVLSLRGAVRRQTATLQSTQTALRERIKEQQCLHAVFRATEDLAAALPDVMREVANLLPHAWLYPDIAVASVEIDGELFSTGKLADAVARLEAEIRVAGVRRGKVTVAYTAPRAPAHEGPFQAEERILLDAVAQRLASTLQRREAVAHLREAEARFRSLFESSSEALMLMTGTQFLDCNDATLRLLGVGSKVQFLKLTPADLSPPLQPCGTPSDKKAMEIIEQVFKKGSHEVEVLLRRYDDGSLIPVEITATSLVLDNVPTLLINLRDLTERKRYEEQINRLAFYDALTQLPNRRLLHDRLSQALAQHRRSNRHGCVIYLDLDNFKPLNDLHGHVAGDILLKEVGQRLVGCVRAQDTVARLGGDEFVVLLIGLDESWDVARNEATHLGEKILDELARPYVLTFEQGTGAMKTVEHRCTASLGIAIFRPTETNIDNLLQRADDAMYRAKAKGRNQIQLGET